MYWLPKFKHANPWPIPKLLPDNKIELAKLALKRMAFDINNELTVWKVGIVLIQCYMCEQLCNSN